MNYVAITLAILGMSCSVVRAQTRIEIPTEVFAGHEQLQHEYFFFSPLENTQKLGLFTTARFLVDYEETAFNPQNSSFINTLITYNFTPNWGLAGGAFYADRDFAPTLAGSYTYYSTDGTLFINLFPSWHIRSGEDDLELFGFAIYEPRMSRTLCYFTQFTFSTVMKADLSDHVFSYQQLRVGLGFNRGIQAGIGLTINHFETEGFASENAGLFIRKVLR